MKSESLFYPYEVVMNMIPDILEQRGCKIMSVNSNNGVIEATHKEGIFKRNLDINVMLDKRDVNETGIVFWANSYANVFAESSAGDDLFEEKLLQTIHKYF